MNHYKCAHFLPLRVKAEAPKLQLAIIALAALSLVGGDSCHGRLVVGSSQACNLNTGNNEARVICRELGCSAAGAQRVNECLSVSKHGQAMNS